MTDRIAALSSSALSKPFDIGSLRPALVRREVPVPQAPKRRTKIWEFNPSLHCSIIGTCLSTVELRHILRKLGLAPDGSTDHDLHGVAVGQAARPGEAARRLHKALDHKHTLLVSQFDRASTEDEVRVLWRDAAKRGEIPGAYWATLTHAATTHALIREAFGEVHMLSHLVGAANRADIRRLQALESENARLQQALEEQELALRESIAVRDKQINELRGALARPNVRDSASETAELRQVIADLEHRLDNEMARRLSLEERTAAAETAAACHLDARKAAEEEAEAARRELEAVEATLGESAGHDGQALELDGLAVLYVGGRPNQLPAMRMAVDRLGGILLHHDGGIENHTSLLPGLIKRADLVVFPVDCVSHDAANAVKAQCRQSGKAFVPLRSSSMTALLSGLRTRTMAAPVAAE